MPVAPRQSQCMVVQHAHDLGYRSDLQERLKDKLEPFLDGKIRILEDDAAWIADQANREHEGKFAALGLGKQTCGQTTADRMQFKLGDGALQAEQKAAVGTAGVINAIAIRDEAAAQATDIQERVPIGTVAREPGHIDGQDQPDLAETDPPDEFLEAVALCSRSCAQTEIGIDDIDIDITPAQFTGALAQRVLQAQALLVAHDLMRRRLADVNHRFAFQMRWLDQFGHHETSPPESRRPRRGLGPVTSATASSNDRRGRWS